MGETDLSEIENRINQYPPRARHDILRLTRELRSLRSVNGDKRTAQSPLYDRLTGLLNGGAYGVRFAMARARAARYRKIFAVMSVNVAFHTTHGKDAAAIESERDQIIKGVAERLEDCVRATDTLARIGDENFVIILEDLAQPGHAERVKQNVEDALAERGAGQSRLSAEIAVRMQFYPGTQADGKVYN